MVAGPARAAPGATVGKGGVALEARQNQAVQVLCGAYAHAVICHRVSGTQASECAELRAKALGRARSLATHAPLLHPLPCYTRVLTWAHPYVFKWHTDVRAYHLAYLRVCIYLRLCVYCTFVCVLQALLDLSENTLSGKKTEGAVATVCIRHTAHGGRALLCAALLRALLACLALSTVCKLLGSTHAHTHTYAHIWAGLVWRARNAASAMLRVWRRATGRRQARQRATKWRATREARTRKTGSL